MISRFSLIFFFVILCTKLSAQCFPCFNQNCWQGFYISGQIGSGWNDEDVKFVNDNFFNTVGPVVLGSHFNFGSDGLIGGGIVGYNYQDDCVVAGVEGGVLSLNLKKSISSPFFPDIDVYSTNLEYLATARFRIGLAYERLLTFFRAGWAGGNVSLKLNDTSSNILASSKDWANGWTVGIGAEYQVFNNISFGLAYDYFQFQYKHKSIACPGCGSGIGFGTPVVNNHLHVQTLLFSISYLFNL